MKTVLFLLSGFLLMMFLGTVYAWSVFRVEVEMVYQSSTLQSGLPYMTSLFFYAISMMITGRLLTINNTRMIVLIGVMLVSVGWFLSSVSTTLLLLTMSYGVLIGVGVGMVYGVPVFIVNQRYEKSGLYTGIILSGFGASPLVMAPLVHIWIKDLGLTQTFFIMGTLTLIVLLPLAFMFKTNTVLLKKQETKEYPFSIKTFVLLYTMFLIATTIGLMMIGLSYRIGVINYRFNVNHVALSLSFFAVLNGIARPLFGWIVDKKGFIFGSGLSISLIVFASLIALFNQGNSLVLYGLSMGLFWFNLGAWLAMLPASIKVYFGTHLYAKRYGLMFTSYGFGAIIGTVLSGVLLDVFIETRFLYILVLVIIVIVLFVTITLKNLRFSFVR